MAPVKQNELVNRVRFLAGIDVDRALYEHPRLTYRVVAIGNAMPFHAGSFDLVTVLHVADALAHERFEEDASEPPPPAFDEAYLRRLGLEDRIDAWRRLATEARLAA